MSTGDENHKRLCPCRAANFALSKRYFRNPLGLCAATLRGRSYLAANHRGNLIAAVMHPVSIAQRKLNDWSVIRLILRNADDVGEIARQ